MTQPRYSLIIPAHNEAERIGRSLAGYLRAFADSEVIVVLNGCTDDTELVARRAAGSHPNLRVLRIDHAVGKGGAVRAGFLAAQASVIGYVDADGATSPDEMRRLFESLAGYDAVIASRWSKGSQVDIAQPMMRRLASRVFNAIVRVLFGLPFHDTQCGAKVFSSSALLRIASTLEIANFAFDIDVLYNLRRAGLQIHEVPTRWHDIVGSRIDLSRATREMLSAVLRLRLQYSLFRYVIPLVDRLWPTTTLRVRHGLAVLVVGLYDPANPRAGESERYLEEVGASLVSQGHRVAWLTGGFAGAPSEEVRDGIRVVRAGNGVLARFAIPLKYLGRLRNRYDVIIEVQHGPPLFSPLFSLKPKICLVTEPSEPRDLATRSSTALIASLRRAIIGVFYRSSRFIAVSERHGRHLQQLGIERERIEIAGEASDDGVKRTFLHAVYAAVSQSASTYVLSGSEWAIVRQQSRFTIAGQRGRSGNAETLLINNG